MTVRFAMLLDDANARRLRRSERVDMLLLGRTLVEPPRAAACRRWGQMLRRTFPRAELVPYVWHLVTHGPEDGLRDLGTRHRPGAPHELGRLADTPAVAQALEVVRICADALGATRLAFRTPSGLTPGVLGRARITEFCARMGDGAPLVWEPEGLWTPAEAMALTAPIAGLDVLLAGFEGGRPRRTEEDDRILAIRGAWLRIDGFGPRRTLHGGHLDALVEHVDAVRTATLVFTGPRADLNLQMAADALAAEGL